MMRTQDSVLGRTEVLGVVQREEILQKRTPTQGVELRGKVMTEVMNSHLLALLTVREVAEEVREL